MTEAAKSIRAVERAIDVLACFGRQTPVLSISHLEKRVRLSRPTLYRLLQTLENKGMVRRVGEPLRYALGHRVVEIAGGWSAPSDVASVARPFLRELWQETDETVALYVPVGEGQKICLEELPSTQALVFRRGSGITEPLARGSSGKAMLAFMAPREIDAAVAEISGVAAQAGMRAELAQIRTALHAVSESEIIAGAVAIGAPVFDHAGKIAASVCVYGPETRLGGQDRRRVVKGTRRTAERISAALGYRQAEHTGAHVRAAAE